MLDAAIYAVVLPNFSCILHKSSPLAFNTFFRRQDGRASLAGFLATSCYHTPEMRQPGTRGQDTRK